MLVADADSESSVWSQSDDEEPSTGAWLPAGGADSQASLQGLTPEQPGGTAQQEADAAAQQEAERDTLLQSVRVGAPLSLSSYHILWVLAALASVTVWRVIVAIPLEEA